MVVISLKEEKWRLEEKRLEGLIHTCAGMYEKCSIHPLMGYADALENINPENPFIKLAEGVLYSIYTKDRSYGKSLYRLNSFLEDFPENEYAIVWRLRAATNFASGTSDVSFLPRIAIESMKLFPQKIPVLYAAYDAYSRGMCNEKESLRIALKILKLKPDDWDMRENIAVLRKMIYEKEHKPATILAFRKKR